MTLKALVTSGPTQEPIDPVRYITNRSSGRQGHAIAKALAKAGMDVTLVSGPTALTDPENMRIVHVQTAEDMLKACEQALPADVVVCAAAVADWRPSQPSARKLKKAAGGDVPQLALIENPDILAHIAAHPLHRPTLVIGFAAETESVEQNAKDKRQRKGCDWILANAVGGELGFNSGDNQITLISDAGLEPWPLMSKDAIAQKLVERITAELEKKS